MHIFISISSVLISMTLRAALAAPITQESGVDSFPPQPTVVGIIDGRAIAARQEASAGVKTITDDTGDLLPQPTVVETPVKRQIAGSAGTAPDNGDLDNIINQVDSASSGILNSRAVVARGEGSVIVTGPIVPTAGPSEGVTVVETEATPSQTAVVGFAKVRTRQDGNGADIGARARAGGANGAGEGVADVPVPTAGGVAEPVFVPVDNSGNGASQEDAMANTTVDGSDSPGADEAKKRVVAARQVSVISSVFLTESTIVSDTAAAAAAATKTVAVSETVVPSDTTVVSETAVPSEAVSVSDTAVAPSTTVIITART